MSGSAALEYGFPSTHSTNAVSVAVYALFNLHSPSSNLSSTVTIFLESLAYFYATSIIIGRLYCGMHGFFDVVVGSTLGAVLSILQYLYVEDFDTFIHVGSYKAVTIVILIIFVLVRIHPEPADDCPCFDDSVAFAGVMCGAEVGNWHYAHTPHSWDVPVRSTVPFHLETLGWPKTIGRICVGVLCIFIWRTVSKSALLQGLPPLYRIIERLGLSLPRRFFKRASEYDEVPKHLKTDNVIPSVSQLPNFISSIRHPKRSRSISVGPQSAADAYEALLAIRQKRRRESLSSLSISTGVERDSAYFGFSKPLTSSMERQPTGQLQKPASSSQGLHATFAPTDPAADTLAPLERTLGVGSIVRTPSQDRRQNEIEEREIFSKIEKSRVRYDVEVVTKLIVYSGIAWIAVEGTPILFQYVGLGVDGGPR